MPIVARRVDVALPGDHVVEARAEAGIAGPHDAVFSGAKAAGRGAFVSLGAVGHGARVGGQQRGFHAGGLEDAGAQQLCEAAAGALLQDLRQNSKVLIDVGVAGAWREVQRARAGDHAGCLRVAERGLRRRAVQHRHRPVIAQARLVVTQMQRTRRRLLQQRQACAHVVVQHRRIGESVQDRGAGELLGDGAHAEQRARCERNAPLGIRPAPGVAHQHLAVTQHGDCTARSGVGAGEGFDNAIEASGEGGGHGRHCRAPACHA